MDNCKKGENSLGLVTTSPGGERGREKTTSSVSLENSDEEEGAVM